MLSVLLLLAASFGLNLFGASPVFGGVLTAAISVSSAVGDLYVSNDFLAAANRALLNTVVAAAYFCGADFFFLAAKSGLGWLYGSEKEC